MKNNKLRIVSGVVTVILMIIIFLFSAQPAEASDKTSLSLTALLFSGEEIDVLLLINVFVRKAAHMAEYATLAVPCWLFLSTFELKKLWGNLLPFFFSAFYAATDEIHQLFVPGRSGQFKDVLIDSFGALLGIVFINVVMHFIRHHQEKRTAEQ